MGTGIPCPVLGIQRVVSSSINWDHSDGGAERLALSVGASGALAAGAQALVLEQGRLGNRASFILSAVRE